METWQAINSVRVIREFTDQPLDEAHISIGTHNSYSNYTQAFLNPLNTNQLWSITDQLQMGARYIRLDPHWFNSEMRLCHAESNRLQGTSCDAPSVSPGRLYGNGVREIANWLEANPTEVVILTMNDYSEDHDEHIEEPIEEFLGSKVFKPAHKRADRWPTLNEMLAAKRQIIIFSNDTHGDDWIFPKNTWIEAPSYPDNENFLNCFDNDGKKIHDRSQHKWAAITEGRTGSDEIDSHIFLLNEQQVRAATKCGYSMVGVDFLNALHAAWSKYSRDGEDARREASIWSYEDGDFGERGPAVIRGNSGRWYSHLETNYHYAACSLADFSPTGKGWKVTQTLTTYYAADNQCKAEFGPTWKFDFPHNGYENERIRQLALGRDVWTKYSAIKIREVAAAPPYMLFLMDRASSVPPSRTAKVYGIRVNTSYSVNISFQKFMGQDVAPWLAFATTNGGSTDVIRQGGSPLTLRILPAAQNLQVGGYDAMVTLTHSTGVAMIAVHLEIKEPVTVTLTPKLPTVNDGQPVEFTADVSGRRLPGLQDYITGTVILWKLIEDANGNPIDSQEIARGQVNSFDGSSVQDGRATLVAQNLEGGTYKLVAEYVGDGHYGQGMSQTLTYNVQRFITALPNPMRFKVKYNGSSPNSQLLSANVPADFSTLGGNPASFVTMTRASDRSANINVSSIGLEMGHYEQMVIVTSPVNGRHDHVRVFLDVTTSIFGDKQSIDVHASKCFERKHVPNHSAARRRRVEVRCADSIEQQLVADLARRSCDAVPGASARQHNGTSRGNVRRQDHRHIGPCDLALGHQCESSGASEDDVHRRQNRRRCRCRRSATDAALHGILDTRFRASHLDSNPADDSTRAHDVPALGRWKHETLANLQCFIR